MRLSLTLLAMVACCSAAHAEPVPYGGETVSFRALPPVSDPHPLNPHVHYVGGYELEAHGTSQVDGLSDLQLTADGDGYIVEAISDLGAAVTFSLHPDGKGGLKDSPVTIDPLREEDGHAYFNRDFGDAEDIATDPATGTRYASFERNQRIMAYPRPQTWKGPGHKLPLSGLAVFPENFGMEGLTFIHGARGESLLVGVESGGFWQCGLSDYACHAIDGPSPPGFLYMMTSLAVLPDRPDDILALYRYYDPLNGPRNILRHVRLENGKLVEVEDMLKIAPPMPYDNYEGVAAVRIDGGYRLYLICDGLHPEDKPKILIYDWMQ